jgi:hypothetical protein
LTGPKAHGFLFKAAMILAILERRKTQTRRAVTVHNSLIDGHGHGIREHWPKLQWDRAWVDGGPSPAGNPGQYWKVPCSCMGDDPRDQVVHRVYPRVQPGDLIWARETWRAAHADMDRGIGIRYRADDKKHWVKFPGFVEWVREHLAAKWRSALHMPRWATRLELPVLQVRAERVSDIDWEDAVAEGVPLSEDALEDFRDLWDSINGSKPGLSWSGSPPVWIYEWAPPE